MLLAEKKALEEQMRLKKLKREQAKQKQREDQEIAMAWKRVEMQERAEAARTAAMNTRQKSKEPVVRDRDTFTKQEAEEEKKIKRKCHQGGGFNTAKYQKMMEQLMEKRKTKI